MKIMIARLLLLLLLITVIACDDDLELGTSCQTVVVDFYSSHPSLKVIPATFDTIIEQVLKKEGYNEGGATFETVTEQVLIREAHSRLVITAVDSVEILTNTKDSIWTFVPCNDYFDDAQILEIDSEYTTRSWQRLANNGTGNYIEPQYTTLSYFRMLDDASVSELSEQDQRDIQRTVFTLSNGIAFDQYFKDKLVREGSFNCSDSVHYVVR